MKKKIKAVIYGVINFPRIIVFDKLYSRQKYNDLIAVSKKWLAKNSNDYLARLAIGYAYAQTGRFDEGFEYVKDIIQGIRADSIIEKMLLHFVYHEFKKGNYDKIIYRCSYFSSEKMSKKSRSKIDEIVADAHRYAEVSTNSKSAERE